VDRIEQRHRLFRLVRLQRADEVELDAAMALLERGPFRLRLLHAILAEHALAGSDHGLDRIRAERLRNCDQRHRGRIAPGLGASARDLIANLGQRRFERIRRAAHHAILTRLRALPNAAAG
jgi:hypothetical protein